MIEVELNHPINFEILKNLYSENEDLQRAWPGAKYPLCIDEWMGFLSTSDEYASLLYKKDNEYIGHILLKPNGQNQLFICFVILAKKFRSQGIVYEMIQLAEKYTLVNFVHDKLWLHVDPKNTPAVKAYEKLGYVMITMTEAGRYRMSKQIKV